MFTVEVARDMVIDKIDIGQTVYVTNDKKFKKHRFHWNVGRAISGSDANQRFAALRTGLPEV